ncbi:MAG TPA: hypothetical protein ENG66_02070 [Thermococcus sp.]|nr:hypothetical protein [Thermococcus sp.]
MRYAIVYCPYCHEYRIAPFPFETVECYFCQRTLTRKNVVALAFNRDQANLILKDLRKKTKRKKIEKEVFKKLNFKKEFVEMYTQ